MYSQQVSDVVLCRHAMTHGALHLLLQGNENGIRAVVIRLPMFVYTHNFSFFYDVMYTAAEQKGAASYVGKGTLHNSICLPYPPWFAALVTRH